MELKIPSAVTSKCINAIKTDLVINSYDDKILVIVSQYEKFGSWYLVSRESLPWENQEELQEIPIHTELLFGSDDAVLHIYAKHIARTIYQDPEVTKSIIVSIAMKDKTPESLKQIVSLIMENRIW